MTEAQIRFDKDEIANERYLFEERQEEVKQLKDFLHNDEHLGLNEKQLQEFEEATKVKTVDFVEIGPHRLEAWYFSPFPKGNWSFKVNFL